MATYTKSMRLDERTIELIEAQAGYTFTEKFTALVQRCIWELPAKEADLQRINTRINEKYKELNRTTAMAEEYKQLMWDMKNLANRIEQVNQSIDAICKTAGLELPLPAEE